MIFYNDIKVGHTYLVGISKWKPKDIHRENATILTVTEKHDNMIGFRELYCLYHRSDLVFVREIKENEK